VIALGLAQTLAWGSTYYLPAILANAMAAELGLATAWVFTAFSAGLLVSAFLGPAAAQITLHELATRTESLEDAFLSATADSQEYRSGGAS